jgi:hypothetical protein
MFSLNLWSKSRIEISKSEELKGTLFDYIYIYITFLLKCIFNILVHNINFIMSSVFSFDMVKISYTRRLHQINEYPMPIYIRNFYIRFPA